MSLNDAILYVVGAPMPIPPYIPGTRSRNTGTLTTMMMKPGTTKDHPQGPSQVAQMEGMMVPRMLPMDVCMFHIPIIRPRLKCVNYRGQRTLYDECPYLSFPNQWLMTAITAGQPIDCG